MSVHRTVKEKNYADLDREMQVAQLTLLKEELGHRIKTLKNALPKQQKTYRSMGILGGILLAILLW